MKRCLHHRGEMKMISSLALGLATLTGTLCSARYVFAADANVSSSPMPPTVKAFVAKNCAACHQPPNAPLGIDLTTLTFNLSDVDSFGRWVRIHDAVRDGKMPPGGRNVLKEADRAAFVSAVAERTTQFVGQGIGVQNRHDRRIRRAQRRKIEALHVVLANTGRVRVEKTTEPCV